MQIKIALTKDVMRCKSEQLSPKWGARDVPWGCRKKIPHRVLAPKNVLVLARVSTDVYINNLQI